MYYVWYVCMLAVSLSWYIAGYALHRWTVDPLRTPEFIPLLWIAIGIVFTIIVMVWR